MEYSNFPASDLSLTISNTKQSFSIDLVIHHKEINSKESVRRIVGSETFIDNPSEKMEIESLKTEIISSLESTISFLFQKELNTLKDKCEKLMQNSYSNYKGQIESRSANSQQYLTTSLKAQSCKLYNNKYVIPPKQITNTEIFTFIPVLVFKLLSRKVLFINRKDNRNC